MGCSQFIDRSREIARVKLEREGLHKEEIEHILDRLYPQPIVTEEVAKNANTRR